MIKFLLIFRVLTKLVIQCLRAKNLRAEVVASIPPKLFDSRFLSREVIYTVKAQHNEEVFRKTTGVPAKRRMHKILNRVNDDTPYRWSVIKSSLRILRWNGTGFDPYLGSLEWRIGRLLFVCGYTVVWATIALSLTINPLLARSPLGGSLIFLVISLFTVSFACLLISIPFYNAHLIACYLERGKHTTNNFPWKISYKDLRRDIDRMFSSLRFLGLKGRKSS